MIFLSLLLSSPAQEPGEPEKTGYFHEFLLKPGPKSQNHMFMFGYSFIASPIGKSLGEMGTMPWAGINLARFFSRQIVLGVEAECKINEGVFHIRPSSEFSNAFRASLRDTFPNSLDSLNAKLVSYCFRDTAGKNVVGQYIFNYGFVFAPCPGKYGGFMLHVKFGTTRFQLNGMYGEDRVNRGAFDKATLRITNNMIYELSFKPKCFGKNGYMLSNSKRKGDLWRMVILSVYYQQLNFKSAEFNGTAVKDMVKPEFMTKYGTDHRIGFKIALGVY